MRWGVACVLAVVCACKDPPPGLVIAVEVPPAITADHVRLLVSTTKCTNCAGIAPPNAAAKISGEVRFDDAGQMIVDDDVQKLDVNIARFQLLAPQDTKVHIAAVAFDPSDKPLAAALLDDDLTVTPVGSTLVTMELAAVHDNQVAWWPDLMDAKASCTLLRLPGQPATFFVPTIDPDCDGVLAATECDPFAYEFTSPLQPAVQDTNCRLATPADGCHLGELDCVKDGEGPGSCQSFADWCLPAAMCDGMLNGALVAGCDPFADTCVQAKIADGTMTRIDCEIDFDTVGYCGGGAATFVVPQPAFASIQCTAIGFAQADTDLAAPLASLALTSGPTFAFVPGGGSGSGSPDACFNFQAQLTAGAGLPASIDDPDERVVFQTASGENVLVPLHIVSQEAAPSCDNNTPTCTITTGLPTTGASDTIADCFK